MAADRKAALATIGQVVLEQIRQQAQEVGAELIPALGDVATYIAERADHLASVIDEPGFELALKAERDSVCLKAAGRTVVEGDQFDDRLLAAAQAGLALAARMIKLLVPVP